MSSTVSGGVTSPDTKNGGIEALGKKQSEKRVVKSNYKGFVAGVFSGIAKLSGAWSK